MEGLREYQFAHACSHGPVVPADAIALLTGEGYDRVPTALELFARQAAPLVFITGSGSNPPFAVKASELGLVFIEKGASPDRILVDDESPHTAASARAIVAEARDNDWKRVLLVTSSYHVPRAMLSVIRALLDARVDHKIDVIPIASPQPLFEVPEGYLPNRRRIDLLEVESRKITDYRQHGDVCTYDAGLDYIEWWEKHR